MASKLYGDWGKLANLSKLSNAKNEVKEDTLSNAKKLQAEIVSKLKSGGAEGNPLKPNTVKKKGHSTKLYDTGELADSFSIEVLGDKVFVVPKGLHKGGLTNEQLASIHENGNSEISPRPFVRPVWEANEDRIKQEVSKTVETVIKSL